MEFGTSSETPAAFARTRAQVRQYRWLTIGLVGAACALTPAAASAAGFVPTSPATAVAALNAQRADNGIPAGITDNPTWNQDCALHVNWMGLNPNAPSPHDETPGTPGYTAGGAFAGSNAVLVTGGPVNWRVDSSMPWGRDNPWETAPIHLMQLLDPDLDESGWAEGPGTCMITLAGDSRPQPATPQLLTYPGAGTDWVYYAENADELPYTPGQLLGLPDTATGPYLYVFDWGGTPGKITSASLVGPAGLVAVATADNDTTSPLGSLAGYTGPGGMIIPLNPLTPGATYTASVTFTPDLSGLPQDAQLSDTWSFTVARTDSGLAGSLSKRGLYVSSKSSAPVTVTITDRDNGTLLQTITVPSKGTTLPDATQPGTTLPAPVPGGSYRVCFSQPENAEYYAASICHNTGWHSSPGLHLTDLKLSQRQARFKLTAASSATGYRAAVCAGHSGEGSFCDSVAAGDPAHHEPGIYDRAFKLKTTQTLTVPLRDHPTVLIVCTTPGVKGLTQVDDEFIEYKISWKTGQPRVTSSHVGGDTLSR